MITCMVEKIDELYDELRAISVWNHMAWGAMTLYLPTATFTFSIELLAAISAAPCGCKTSYW